MPPARHILPIVAVGLAVLALTACGPRQLAGTAAPAGSPPPPPNSAAPASPGPAATTSRTSPQGPTSYVDFERNGLVSQVPYGWTRDARADDHTDFRDAGGQLLLRLVDQHGESAPDPYVRQLAAKTASSYPQYKLIRFSGLTAGTGQYEYAEWEFTFVKDGVLRHVVEAAVGREGDTSTYGLVYYSAPVHYFDTGSDAYYHALRGIDFAG